MTTKLTIENLKARRNYIIAKITKVAGEENVKDYMKLMAWIVSDQDFTGTIYDLFMDVHYQLRKTRRSSKLADMMSNIHTKTNGENYNYAKNKLGSSVAMY